LYIVADKITVESPYRATLTSIFPDGTRRQRKNVEGVLQRKYLNNIRAIYSPVREIKELKAKEKDPYADNMDLKIEKNDKRSSKDKNNNLLDHNHNDNYILQDWDNQKINFPSDQMTQKSSTRSSEKEKELPLVLKPHNNSAQKQLHVSNFTILSVYVLALFSTVLSVNLSRNHFIVYSLVTR
jgi:hypothetical protein